MPKKRSEPIKISPACWCFYPSSTIQLGSKHFVTEDPKPSSQVGCFSSRNSQNALMHFLANLPHSTKITRLFPCGTGSFLQQERSQFSKPVPASITGARLTMQKPSYGLWNARETLKSSIFACSHANPLKKVVKAPASKE